jgi:short-subunit dehydrogenase
MMQRDLKGHVILVTGCTGTLGTAVCRRIASSGGTLVLLGRNIKKLEKLYDALLEFNAETPAMYPLDLLGATEKDYEELSDTLQQQMGGVHAIIHCAAELGQLSPLREMEASKFQKLMHLNLTAPVLLTQALLRIMSQQKLGVILFLGDSAVGDGKAFWGAYGIAKIGLKTYANILNAEIESQGLSAETFTPGPMRSPIRMNAYPGENLETLPSSELVADVMVERLIHQLTLSDNPLCP